MRIGCCIPGAPYTLFTGYQALRSIGFDFAECAAGVLLQLTEDQLNEAAELYRRGQFQIESCNVFLPSGISLVGDAPSDYVPHITEVYRRMQMVGAKTIVFGSGRARRIPEGFSPQRAQSQLDEFLRTAAEIARGYHITVVIEPLNHAECNVLTSVPEAASYVRRIDHPNLRLLADAYHMAKDDEPFEVLKDHLDLLHHIHVAETPSRRYPGADGGEGLIHFSHILHECGYHGTVTLECTMSDFESEAPLALSFMRQYF